MSYSNLAILQSTRVIARRGLEAKEKVTIRQEIRDSESNRETEWVDAYTSTWYPNIQIDGSYLY